MASRRRLRVALALLAASAAASPRSHRFAPPHDRARPLPTLPNVTLGPVEVVVDWASQHCSCAESPGCTDPNDPDVSDTPARAFVDGAGLAHLWSTDAESRQSLRNASRPGDAFVHNCTVHAASQFDCRPSAYNFQTWLHSPFALPDGERVFALVHMEYHGWSCLGNSSCSENWSGNCANEAVQLFVSEDGGLSFAPTNGGAGPPANLLAVSPYTYEYARDNFNKSELGFGDPTSVVFDRATRTFNVLISASNPPIGINGYSGLQQRGQCLFRVAEADVLDASAWRAWDGQGFGAIMSADPYAAPIANLSAHVCAPVNTSMLHVNLGWSTLFNKWISSGFGSYEYANGTVINCCGAFLYSVSDDLLNWETPQLLRPQKQEGQFPDWEYDAAFLDETAWTALGERNWHSVIGADTAALYFWQQDVGAENRGRSIKRQSVSFLGAAAPGDAGKAPVDADQATLAVSTAAPFFVADENFLGVNIDSASLTNYIDFGDAYLLAMAGQLARAAPVGAPRMHLRVGGSASNGLYYVPQGVPGRGPGGSTCMTDASLAALDAFARAAGLQVTLCLQYQTRSRGGPWDPSINASALWAMLARNNLTSFTGFSLGNEIIGGSGFDVPQYSADYVRFRAAVAAEAPAWAQRVVGPSAAGWPGLPPMQTFLTATRALQDMSVSIHAYSFGNCSLATYTSKVGIEKMAYYFGLFGAARDAFAPSLPVYLEEMATQAGGGCDGLSNRFVSGFWFIHSLGLAGANRVSRVTRQDLAGW